MSHATLLWSVWQDLLGSFAWAFTRRGFRRFAEWITAMALNVEEHTITQSVLALDRPADWKALESFAEYGAWHPDRVTRGLTRLVERAPGRHLVRLPRLGRRRHQGPSRRPPRLGHLHLPRVHRPLPQPGHHRAGPQLGRPGRACWRIPSKPAWFLPISGRLYFRKSQLPPPPGMAGPTVEFRTKCELAVELIRDQARYARGPHLAIFDGGFALRSVVRPLVLPERRRPADRVPHPAAARCPALRPAADGAAQGQARAEAEVGQAAAAAAAGGPLGRAVAHRRWPSSTAACGRSAGRRWSACGECSGTRCRSRRWSPVSRGTRSGSPWSPRRWG